MYELTKRYRFSAAHHLEGLKAGHPCSNVHGHNYLVTVAVAGVRLDQAGMLLDYREMDNQVKPLLASYDHADLNEQMATNPTVEHLARHLFDVVCPHLPGLAWVKVQEGEETGCTYTPEVRPEHSDRRDNSDFWEGVAREV